MARNGGRATEILRRPACALLALTLAACGSYHGGPTGYTKASPFWTSKYGYSDKRIDGDEFAIVVTGNPVTGKERVAEIALLRAARLTREERRTHFLVLKQKTQTLAAEELVSVSLGGLLVWVPVGTRTVEEPMAVLLIRLLPVAASYPPDALDAEAIIERLAFRLG